jgi:hypothetical protein
MCQSGNTHHSGKRRGPHHASIVAGPSGGSRIQRANLDGSGVEDLVTTGLNSPWGIALDVAAGATVGGIAELPDIAGSGDSPAFPYAALASGAAALLALTAGAWYTRRRWGR